MIINKTKKETVLYRQSLSKLKYSFMDSLFAAELVKLSLHFFIELIVFWVFIPQFEIQLFQCSHSIFFIRIQLQCFFKIRNDRCIALEYFLHFLVVFVYVNDILYFFVEFNHFRQFDITQIVLCHKVFGIQFQRLPIHFFCLYRIFHFLIQRTFCAVIRSVVGVLFDSCIQINFCLFRLTAKQVMVNQLYQHVRIVWIQFISLVQHLQSLCIFFLLLQYQRQHGIHLSGIVVVFQHFFVILH